MRDRTRSYTTDLPRIGLPFLADVRRRLEDAGQRQFIHCQTASGLLVISRQADSYTASINNHSVALRTDTTQAGYGVRHWYLCPHCCKRTAKLYISSKTLACRGCFGLHYASQSEDRLGRMRMMLRRQRYAIWGNTEQTRNLTISLYLFPKPKGMRWETFDRKVARLMRYEEAYWRAFSPVVDRITGRLR